jgi:hypothetical protein
VLIATDPLRIARATRFARPRLFVHTLAASPYSLALAIATASASLSKRTMVATGPKISSRATRCELSASNAVGLQNIPAENGPSSCGGPPPKIAFAPSAAPIAQYSLIFSYCSSTVIAQM